jgi:methionyl-tRNA formyltransferase
MKVLLLGAKPSPLKSILEENRCKVIEGTAAIDLGFLEKSQVDYAISYRFRQIIRKPIIEYLKGDIINLHISLLPWNRGADPNLWSFLENTPKGVTIHYIDEGIDTGDIIAQKEIFFDDNSETLASSYEKLNREIIKLFKKMWPLIMNGKSSRCSQPPGGTFHRTEDKKPFEKLLIDKGWNTPVKKLIGKASANKL